MRLVCLPWAISQKQPRVRVLRRRSRLHNTRRTLKIEALVRLCVPSYTVTIRCHAACFQAAAGLCSWIFIDRNLEKLEGCIACLGTDSSAAPHPTSSYIEAAVLLLTGPNTERCREMPSGAIFHSHACSIPEAGQILMDVLHLGDFCNSTPAAANIKV